MERPASLVNVVVTANLHTSLDLTAAAALLPGCRYDRFRFSAAIWRCPSVKGTALIFSTGSVVCSGLKCTSDAPALLSDLVCWLSLEPDHDSIKVQLMVGAGHTGFHIDIAQMQSANRGIVVYEPELFTGATVRLDGLCCLVFHTGSYTITGAKTWHRVKHVEPVLRTLLITLYN